MNIYAFKRVLASLFLTVIIALSTADSSKAGELTDLKFLEGLENEISITLSFAGDCTLGTDVKYGKSGSFMEMYEKQADPDKYFFANVKSIFEEDDLTIVNLEGALTNATKAVNKQFTFRGLPQYTGILKEGSIELVNLANNHTNDYGDIGYKDTISNLTSAGISYYGLNSPYITEIKGIKAGFLGYTAWSADNSAKNKIAKDIAKLKEQGVKLIITTFHGGVEGSNYPNSQVKTLAKHSIDSGSDLVIAHHPHVIQGIELYNGKYIAYSLGNFSFGGNRNPADKDTFIFQQTFLFDKSTQEKTYGQALVYPCSISSVAYRNNYQPTPLEGAEIDRFMGRLKNYSYALNANKDIVTSLNAHLYINQPEATDNFIVVEQASFTYGDTQLQFELPVLSKNDVIYVSMREFFQSMNADIVWDGQANAIYVVAPPEGDNTYCSAAAFTVGDVQLRKFLTNRIEDSAPKEILPVGSVVYEEIETAPFIYDGNTYLSLTTLLEVFDSSLPRVVPQ